MAYTQFPSSFFRANREHLLAQLPPDSLVVMTAHGEQQFEIDSAYPFLQEANFWYLTGIDAPDWQLIIDGQSREAWLVSPEVDEVQQLFNGSLPVAQAVERSGISNVIDQETAATMIRQKAGAGLLVYSIAPLKKREHGFYTNPAQAQLWQRLKQYNPGDIRTTLHKLRGIKQPLEIAAIQDAVNVTVDAFLQVLPTLKEMHHEYQVEGFMSGFFRSQGAEGHAYSPIVASGMNACTLHYGANQAAWQKNDWLLMDVGARAVRYTADITRTVPLGEVSAQQAGIYAAVQKVHDFAISLCRPGQNVAEYVEKVDVCMLEQLCEVGLAKNMQDKESLRLYSPHAVSHGLGVETHDPLGAPKQFEVGMVLTVEPGIYDRNQALGIRIEDDILITPEGPKVLSERLPWDLQKLQEMV